MDMTTAIDVGAGVILVGDARAQLLEVPEASCRAAITSPPYWGLRLYGGGEAELGREQSVDEYVGALLDTMRLVRRCLTPDGTLWLNLGDCYPEQLVEPLVRVSSEPGDAILDPFLGSGTTAVVAQRHGRRWWGCELTPSYAEIAAARIRARVAQVPLRLEAPPAPAPGAAS